MGNSLTNGFNDLPSVYLRDLRRKTRRRFKSILTTQKSGKGDEKKTTDDKAATELNTKSVSEYVITNPTFLDNLVKNHISQDRVKAWIKPVYEDNTLIETVDYEGNVEVSEQDEAEKEEEEILKSSSSKPAVKEITSTSSREIKGKLASDPVTRKFSKSTLQILPEIDKEESEEELEEKKNEENPVQNSPENKTDSEPMSSEDESSLEKNRKKSRGDSNFQQQVVELKSKQRKILLITRSRLLYPEIYKNQELNALLERPDLGQRLRELESPFFPYTEIPYEDINKVFILMCRDLLGEHGFPRTELCYFLTTLQANYQNVEYHNYSHALSHAQTMYWILRRTPGVFTELEMKALMIASISHDVGHPGLNETYLKKVRCTLALMYNDPILEHHHIQTLFLILQDIRCNIFIGLNSDDYKQVLRDIKYTIEATNVSKYKTQCEKMRQIDETGADFRKKHVKNALMALIMMTCDLCSSWKKWDEHKNIIWSLYKEFFNQGDKETNFGITTPDFMLRTNAEHIPKYQVSFIEIIVIPILELLTKMFPQLNEIQKATKENLDCWKTYG